MTETLKPYPLYKESGVPWLGKIPNGWALPRLGNVLRERAETNDDGRVTEVLSVMRERGVIPYAEKGHVGNKKSDDITRYKIVRPNDIVVNCMNVIIGSVGLSRYTGCLSPVYYVLTRRTEEDDPRYLNAYFQMRPFQQSLVRIGNGILAHRMRIPMELLKCEPFPLPPPEDQAAIVRFIGLANTRIARAIRVKRRLIALLNEQKQAIILRAVTRGIDSTVAVKPSGINQVGEIPEHWQTPLFGRCITRIEQGWSPVAAEGELAADQWAVLTLSAVRRGAFNPSAVKPISQAADIPTDIEIAEGDFLLTRSNTRDRVGDVCVARSVRPRTILCDLIYRLRLREGAFDLRFLTYQLLSPVGRGQIERDARGSSGTMPKIAQTHIRAWRVLLPSKDEQSRIVEWIETETAQTNTTITRLEREIELLQEYRTRLVADVVTGKFDVRSVELPGVELVEQTEPLVDVTEVEEDEAEAIEENTDADN